MKRSIRTIRDVVDWRLCAGCGACYAACDKGAITLEDMESLGIRPGCDETLCADCAECLAVCPGYEVNAEGAMNEQQRPLETDHEFGHVLELWEGYAADPVIRRQASSGGILSALALHCLERERMGFVLHAGMDPGKPWLNRTFQSRSRREILARGGSRYSPASPCDGLRAVEESDSPCVFIGKPCDTAGATMLRRRRPELDRKLGLVLAFFCAGTPSTRGTLDLLESLEVTCDRVDALRYRGEGWPGDFKVLLENRTQERSLAYMKSWGRLTRYVAFRCRLCPDGLGRLSDITCGDAWESFRNDGDAGRSIVLVRTPRGREILRRAIDAGYLNLQPIEAQAVFSAQPDLLDARRQLFGRLLALRLFQVPIPRFRGFSLFYSWRRLPFTIQIRSILGTMRRIVQRRLRRRQGNVLSAG